MMDLPINKALRVIYCKLEDGDYKYKVIFITNALNEYRIIEVSDNIISSIDISLYNEVFYVATNGDCKDLSSYLKLDLDVYHNILQNCVLKNKK